MTLTKLPDCGVIETDAKIAALQVALVALERLMDERDRRCTELAATQGREAAIALAAAQKADDKAARAIEKRLDAMNEFRGMVEVQAKEYARASEVKLALDNHKIVVEAYHERVEGLAREVHDNTSSLLAAQNTATARRTGSKDVWGYVLIIAGLLLSLANIGVLLIHVLK